MVGSIQNKEPKMPIEEASEETPKLDPEPDTREVWETSLRLARREKLDKYFPMKEGK
jgi:hypothetical protein